MIKILALSLIILSATPQPEETKIISVYKEFTQAFKDKNLEGILEHLDYSEKATMLLGTSLLKGQQIRTYYENTMANLKTVNELVIDNIRVTMLNNNSAILHCTFDETLTQNDGQQLHYDGAALYYFVKAKNKWIIQHSSGSVACQ